MKSFFQFVSWLLVGTTFVLPNNAKAQGNNSYNTANLESQIRTGAAAVEKKMIGWREDIHQHPELGDAETRTSKLVAEHLKSLGI